MLEIVVSEAEVPANIGTTAVSSMSVVAKVDSLFFLEARPAQERLAVGNSYATSSPSTEAIQRMLFALAHIGQLACECHKTSMYRMRRKYCVSIAGASIMMQLCTTAGKPAIVSAGRILAALPQHLPQNGGWLFYTCPAWAQEHQGRVGRTIWVAWTSLKSGTPSELDRLVFRRASTWPTILTVALPG